MAKKTTFFFGSDAMLQINVLVPANIQVALLNEPAGPLGNSFTMISEVGLIDPIKRHLSSSIPEKIDQNIPVSF